MKNIDELFSQAYGLAVGDEKPLEGILICREIIRTNPSHHMARMLLANLLDDHGDESEIAESRRHYIEAIRRSPRFDETWDAWYEEDPVYNLAVWEERHGNKEVAKLLFSLDKLFKKTVKSYRKPKPSQKGR